MRKGWKEVRLGDVIILNYGKALSSINRKTGSIPVYSSAGITGFHDDPLVDGAGVIVGRKGSVGTVYYSSSPFLCIDTAYYILPSENYNLKYIYYRLRSLGLENLNEDSAVPGLNRDTTYNQIFLIPPLSEQHTIASILSVLDNKIALNKKINHHLEQQCCAFYQRFFAEERDPSWESGIIADFGEVIGGGTPSKAKPEYYTENGIAWITPKDLSMNKNKFISRGEIDISDLGFRNSSVRIMPRGTVLFSSRAPIGYIGIACGDVGTNQGFKSIVPREDIGTAFVYFFLKNNLKIIEGMASGSTFKEVSGTTLKNIPVIIPDNQTLSSFASICNPIFEQQELLEQESVYLTTLRDALLPKLMSGELSVADLGNVK